MFSRTVGPSPLMASAWPRTSMVSRSSGDTLIHLIELSSILLILAKNGNSWRLASP